MDKATVLLQILGKEIDMRIEALATGSCTHEEYLKNCGVIYGLRTAVEEIKALQHDEDENDE